MNPTIDLSFRISGETVPLDHGYLLYSSLSKMDADLHEAQWLGIHPINGTPAGQGRLGLTQWSRLRFRIPADNISKLIALAGKRLALRDGGRRSSLTLGVPEVHLLKPAANLFAHYVTIKLSETEKTNQLPNREMFSDAIKAQLERITVRGDVWIDAARDFHDREYSRRVIRIKQKVIICYSVYVRNLSEEDSLRLQEIGVGGRRRMGCGLFIPAKEQ
jgi:CRISPR-associated endonuclease/helicase Cas3